VQGQDAERGDEVPGLGALREFRLREYRRQPAATASRMVSNPSSN